jgi:hypothetical protein
MVLAGFLAAPDKDTVCIGYPGDNIQQLLPKADGSGRICAFEMRHGSGFL